MHLKNILHSSPWNFLGVYRMVPKVMETTIFLFLFEFKAAEVCTSTENVWRTLVGAEVWTEGIAVALVALEHAVSVAGFKIRFWFLSYCLDTRFLRQQWWRQGERSSQQGCLALGISSAIVPMAWGTALPATRHTEACHGAIHLAP